MLRAVVTGIGACLPQKIVTNRDLESIVDTTHEWIVERTGIHQRHIAGEGELTSHFAAGAAKAAMQKAGCAADDIDLIILATATPDKTMPATATKVQQMLGIRQGAAFDINAACSGFIYGMHIATALIATAQAKRVLVIGAETFSRVLDWKDRSTCILFGDGAGAVVLEAQEGSGGPNDRGVLASSIHSDGEYHDLLQTTGGVSSTGTSGVLLMQGKEVFRHAVDKMVASVHEALRFAKLHEEDITWIVPHQANWRILHATAKKLNLPDERLISTVKDHANTSAASIPLALSVAAQKGMIKKGDVIVMPALGAGLTWGACILRW